MLIPGTPQGYDFFQFVGDDAHIVPNEETMDFTGHGRAGACSCRLLVMPSLLRNNSFS